MHQKFTFQWSERATDLAKAWESAPAEKMPLGLRWIWPQSGKNSPNRIMLTIFFSSEKTSKEKRQSATTNKKKKKKNLITRFLVTPLRRLILVAPLPVLLTTSVRKSFMVLFSKCIFFSNNWNQPLNKQSDPHDCWIISLNQFFVNLLSLLTIA